MARGGGNNSPPVADPGDAQTVVRGAVVQLSGAGSSDPENQPLSYTWQLVSKPAGSGAVLNNTAIVNPHFTADLAGDYLVRLVVNDGGQSSPPSDVAITANAAPTANAGNDQNGVDLGVVVNLTGAASADPELQPLTYAWSFVSKPATSGATLGTPTSATPTFTPDVGGIYVVQLIVNDGTSASTPDQVTITTRRLITLAPSSLSLSTSASGQLTVTVAYASPSPLVLTLQSSNTGAATVPASVTILANQLSASFNVTGGASSGGGVVSATGSDGSRGSAAVAVGTRLVQWNVDASGAWETASNWTGNAVPGAGEVVVLDRPSGTFVVTLSSATPALASLLSRETLAINGGLVVNGATALEGAVTLTGTMSGTGAVMLNGAMTWTAGSFMMAGGLTVLPGRTVVFPNNNTGRALVASSIVNHGTVSLGDGNALTLQNPVSIINAADGVWTMANGIIGSNGGGTLSFVNAGTFRKTGTGGLTLNGFVPYTNTGTFDIQAGGLALGDAVTVTNSGVINVGATATVYLNQFTLAAGTTFTGAGALNMNGTTTVTGNVTLTLPATLTGTLTGAGTVHVAAPFTWTAGSISSLTGGFEVLSGKTVTMPNNNTGRALVNAAITNHGTVNMGDTNALTLQNPASITNASDGVFSIVNGIIGSNGAGALAFTNAGMFRKTGAAALTLNGFVPYTNTGTFDIQAGTLSLGDAATVTNSGTIAVAAGALVNMNAVTLNAGTVVSGTGTLNMNGTTTINTVVTSPAAVTLTQALTGTGTLKMAAPMTWSSGVLALSGGVEILAGRTLALSGGIALVTSSGTSVKNFGTVNWTSPGSFTYQGGSIAIRKEAGGVWNLGAGSFTITNNGAPTPAGSFTFVNAGTMQGAGNPATTLNVSNSVAFSNTGTLGSLLFAPF